jgi:hypothetical protein
MTILELKNTLNNYPDDMKIFIATDQEGNYFNPLCFVGDEFYDDLTGEFYSEEDLQYAIDEELEDEEPEELNRLRELTKSLIIWP